MVQRACALMWMLLLGGCANDFVFKQPVVRFAAPAQLPAHVASFRIESPDTRVERFSLGLIEFAREALAPITIQNDDIVLATVPRAACGELKLVTMSERAMNAARSDPEDAMYSRWNAEESVLLSWKQLNGVNTTFRVEYPSDRIIVALKRMAHTSKDVRSPIVYVPQNPSLNGEEVRRHGYAYLRTVIAQAQELLFARDVRSKAFEGEQVADLEVSHIALMLAVIEHIDPARMYRHSMTHLANEVLFVVGANEGISYPSARSTAHAFGLFQFIPSTYARVREKYPEAGLVVDFYDGMRNHVNAAAAALVLLDNDLSRTPEPYRTMIRNNPEMLMDYAAAMYNSGRGWKLLEKHKEKWREHLPRETRLYLEKLHALDALLKERERFVSLP